MHLEEQRNEELGKNIQIQQIIKRHFDQGASTK